MFPPCGFWFFETFFHCAAQTALKLKIPLPPNAGSLGMCSHTQLVMNIVSC